MISTGIQNVCQPKVYKQQAFWQSKQVAQTKRSLFTNEQKGFKQTQLNAGREETLGTSYASALMDLAENKNAVKKVQSDVEQFRQLVLKNEKIKTFLFNPTFGSKQKKDVIDEIAKKGEFNQQFKNFLYLLLEKNRLPQIAYIADAFDEKCNQKNSTKTATVKSAVPLSKDQLAQITKKLQSVTKSKNIKLSTTVDPDLLGGFVIEFGSTYLDLSIKGQLEKISGELAQLSA